MVDGSAGRRPLPGGGVAVVNLKKLAAEVKAQLELATAERDALELAVMKLAALANGADDPAARQEKVAEILATLTKAGS